MKTKSTLLTKVMLLFFSLLVPLMIVSFMALQRSNNLIEEQVLNSINSSASDYASQLDESIQGIYLSNIPLSNQSNILRLASISSHLSDYTKFYTINLIREQLTNICAINPLIQSAHIYFYDLERVCNSENYSLESFQSVSEDDYHQLASIAKEPGTLHYYCNPLTNLYTLSVFILPQTTSNPSFIIEMKISKINIQATATAANFNNDDYYYLSMCDEFTATNLDPKTSEALKVIDLSHINNDSPSKIIVDDKPYILFYYTLPYSNGYLVRLVSANVLTTPMKLSTLTLTLFFVVLIIACIFFFIGIYRLIHRPLKKLTNGFQVVENGDFTVQITDTNPSDFSYLYNAFNDMTKKLDQLMEFNYNQKILLQKAELKQLQAQINPHFLYNSFFMMQRMIKSGLTDETQEMASSLGKYFSYITRNSIENVTLSEEYEHAKIYSYIQSLRFEGRISIDFHDIPKEYCDLPVPKLVLQPILENAFNHGLENKVSEGLLLVRFKSELSSIRITIEDNGDDLTDINIEALEKKLQNAATYSNTFEMSGLLNIHRRLIIFSDLKSSIQVKRSTLGGLCVSINLEQNV